MGYTLSANFTWKKHIWFSEVCGNEQKVQEKRVMNSTVSSEKIIYVISAAFNPTLRSKQHLLQQILKKINIYWCTAHCKQNIPQYNEWFEYALNIYYIVTPFAIPISQSPVLIPFYTLRSMKLTHSSIRIWIWNMPGKCSRNFIWKLIWTLTCKLFVESIKKYLCEQPTHLTEIRFYSLYTAT